MTSTEHIANTSATLSRLSMENRCRSLYGWAAVPEVRPEPAASVRAKAAGCSEGIDHSGVDCGRVADIRDTAVAYGGETTTSVECVSNGKAPRATGSARLTASGAVNCSGLGCREFEQCVGRSFTSSPDPD